MAIDPITLTEGDLHDIGETMHDTLVRLFRNLCRRTRL